MPYRNKEQKRQYDIEYRKRNAERLKEHKQSPEYREIKHKSDKKYAEKTKEQKRLYDAEYRKRNAEQKKLRDKRYYEANKEHVKEQAKKYRKNNREKINQYHIIRKQKDPLYKLELNIRVLIRNTIKRKGFNKTTKTAEILGCTYCQFKEHLEKQFQPWMNWNNYGLYNGQPDYGWDIDHIIPVRTAICKDDIIRLNHYTNLQPLCSYYNRDIKKGHLIGITRSISSSDIS